MRPFLEVLPWTEDSSLAMLDRRLDDGIPFQWHHHPEYELTLTRNSRGQRFVGDHVGAYGDYDLVLVGPNLPHTWVSEGQYGRGGPHLAQVIWFDPAWAQGLAEHMVEFRAVGDLVQRAACGLDFGPEAGAALAPEIEAFFANPPRERLVGLLQILCRLQDALAEPLASRPAGAARADARQDRMDRVLAHLHEHFARPVPLGELADIAALSVSGLHRMFRRRTGRTISAYVSGLRIGSACALLSGTDYPIAHVAHQAGYGALANFNRQFRAARGMTPRQYRAHFRSS